MGAQGHEDSEFDVPSPNYCITFSLLQALSYPSDTKRCSASAGDSNPNTIILSRCVIVGAQT